MQTQRLMRSRNDQMIGGVCAGLANYFVLDPTLVRLIFVLMLLFGGHGLLIYLILWVVMPLEGEHTNPPIQDRS
ncbi:MAG: PspC domain-containing protein [Longilinea sp.]|nr:PspC domain-containing protein [Longilinea sp.]MCA1954030.1 PspC domain-containing protein [Anaerolinea sp.]